MLLNRFSQRTILTAIIELLGPEAELALSEKCAEIAAREPVAKLDHNIWMGRDVKPRGLAGGV